MSLELGAIIAIAISVTSALGDYLPIPKKLKAWFALGLILVLHISNEAFFAPDSFSWRASLFEGLTAGLAAVGLYSTSKNSWQQWQLFQQGGNPAQATQTPIQEMTNSQETTNQNATDQFPYV